MLKRVIRDRDLVSDYLTRYYLLKPPRMPDGSWPFDDHGEPRPGIIWPPGTGAVFHHFHKGDDALELHNHPWDWCVSLILRGGYIEERTTREDLTVKRRTFKPGSVNVLTKYDFHRVELLDPVRGCWTLFVYGKKSQGWGFLDRHTGKFTDWRTFIYGVL